MALPSNTQNMDDYEQTHVHNVYNSIASHFSQTRYKPWPIVEQFLKDLPTGSIGLDIGCGNGKYLAVRDDVFIMGSDRSDQLVKIAKTHDRHDALIGDALDPPHPPGRFDFVISIAVLHHLSARERRIEGVRVALDKLRRPGHNTTNTQEVSEHDSRQGSNCGQALFFVWALEQKGSRRGWDEGGEQDVLVPWVLKSPTESSKQGKTDKQKIKGKRRRTGAITPIGQTGAQNDKDHTQHTVSAEPKDNTTKVSGDERQTSHEVHTENEISHEHKTEQVYHRYYHLYRQGELEDDIISAGGEILKNGYDRDNWWCIARRQTT